MEYKFKVKDKSYKIRRHSIADWLCTIIMLAISSGVITFMVAIPSIIECLVESNIL